jgi:hypothetical protein
MRLELLLPFKYSMRTVKENIGRLRFFLTLKISNLFVIYVLHPNNEILYLWFIVTIFYSKQDLLHVRLIKTIIYCNFFIFTTRISYFKETSIFCPK